MKNWIVLLGLIGLSVLGLQGQKVVRQAAVPPAVLEEFEYRFSDAENVVWLQQGDEYYGARFQLKGQAAESIYLPDGQWVQTELVIAYTDMPDSARSYCRGHYPDYQARDVKKVSTRKHGILYEIKVVGGLQQIAMTFDMHGRLIEENEVDTETAMDEEEKESMKDRLNKLVKRKGE